MVKTAMLGVMQCKQFNLIEFQCVDCNSVCTCHLFAAFSLEGSGISFADLFRLVAFYCISR